MAKIADATFNGKTGTYQFQVYPNDTAFKAVGAVYVFTKRTVDSSGKGSHALLYIGQTEEETDVERGVRRGARDTTPEGNRAYADQ